MKSIKFPIILIVILAFSDCSNKVESFDKNQFVNTLKTLNFVEQNNKVIVKPSNRGYDRIFVNLGNGEKAYIQDFDSSDSKKISFFKGIDLVDQLFDTSLSNDINNEFLSKSHKILTNMQRIHLLSIQSDTTLKVFKMYTNFIDRSKSNNEEIYKYVVLFCDSIELVDKSKIIDLKDDELIEIEPKFYLYSSNFYSEYEELH